MGKMLLHIFGCLLIISVVVNAGSDDHVHIKLHIPEVYKKHTHVRTVIKHHFQQPKKSSKVLHRLDPLSAMASSPLHLDFIENFNTKPKVKPRRPTTLIMDDADLSLHTPVRSNRGHLNKMRAAEKYRLMKLYEKQQAFREPPNFEQFSYQSDSEENDDYRPEYMQMQDSSSYGSSALPTDSYSPNFKPSPTFDTSADYNIQKNHYPQWNLQASSPTEESYGHSASWMSPTLASTQSQQYSTLPDGIDDDDMDEFSKYQQFDSMVTQHHPMQSSDDNRSNLYKVERKNPYNGIMKVKKKKYFSNIMAGY